MIISSNNPFFEIRNILCAFYIITMSATWNAIVFDISNFIVNPIYSIESIRAVHSFVFMNLIWLYSTIMTGLFCNPSKKFYIQIPINVPVFRIVFNLAVKLPEGGLASRKFERTPTTVAISFFERRRFYDFSISTSALAKKHSMIGLVIFGSFQNLPFTKFFSGQVNKFHFLSLKEYSQKSVLLSRQYLCFWEQFTSISPIGFTA